MYPRVISVLPNPDYTLTLQFSSGEIRRFDTKPYLDKGIFQELRDPHIFSTVKPFLGSIQWQGGQDFDPDTLYEDSIPIKSPDLESIMDEASNEAASNGLTEELLATILVEKE